MGLFIAFTILSIWGTHLYSLLEYQILDWSSPVMYLRVLFQGYIFTGLFITAHDAMHGSITRYKKINRMVGVIACFLFAGLSYKTLIENHYAHHRYSGTEKDPDFSSSQNYVLWFLTFMKHYTTLLQIVIMAVLFNILKLRYDESRLLLFWILPAFLSTLQLFTFGTFIPHRLPHDSLIAPHNARSLPLNHTFAMITCYFFGYHHEHHESPSTPWWRLYRKKSTYS